MKTIVTHLSVDLDAIASSWLIKRFLPGWDEADMAFVPAGTTLGGTDPDKNPNIIHVDTGLGKFDHHQTKDRNMSATRKVFDYLVKENHIKQKDLESLKRIVDFATSIDHFQEVYFNDPTSDIYDFMLHRIIDGIRTTKSNDTDRCNLGFDLLDGTFQIFKNKINADQEIKKGYVFASKWGKSIALETQNEEVMKLAMKMGYQLVVRKDPEKGFVRVKTIPKKELDLTPIYKQVIKLDPKASWFLHISGNMLINGSSKNPNVIPSSLSLKEVIEIISKI